MESYTNSDYLKYVPNYCLAKTIEAVSADHLSQAAFLREFVDQNRPCVIRGAAAHWPALSKWQSPEYLKGACGNAEVRVFETPRLEGDATMYSPEKKEAIRKLHDQGTAMPFSRFVDLAVSQVEKLPDLFFLYSVRTGDGSPLRALRQDIGTYAFLTAPHRTARNIYPENSIYLYRSSLTDWHYHATAEALQTQIVGEKEVILLPPSDLVWSYMQKIQASLLHTYDADWTAAPSASRVIPFRAKLAPGDALYIPNYWWHFVSTRGHRTLGATVPTWWDSPLHVQMDWRYAAARRSVQSVFSGALPFRKTCAWAPALVGGMIYSAMRRLVRTGDKPWFLSQMYVLLDQTADGHQQGKAQAGWKVHNI